MESGILVVDSDNVLTAAKALSSPLRLKILKTLSNKKMNVRDLADTLGILQSACTMHIQMLEKAGLIKTEMIPAVRGSQKICQSVYNEVVLPLDSSENVLNGSFVTINMPIGLYTDYKIHPPCGILSDAEIIDYLDSEEAFSSPLRSKAQLIWFADGYLEYSFPSNNTKTKKVKSLQIVTEICSEFPGFREAWPSDITLWINGIETGTWTSPGDMGGKRGRFTPKWWGIENSQFGFLKTWRVTNEGSFIDGVPSSAVTLDKLDLEDDHRIRVRIGIKENSLSKGGLNVFGEKFGNHPSGLKLQIEYA